MFHARIGKNILLILALMSTLPFLTGSAAICRQSKSSKISDPNAEIHPRQVTLYPEKILSANEGKFVPYLNIYAIDSPRPLGCVIVCPGGGYTNRARHETDIVAKKFNSLGFHAAVLEYRVYPDLFPAPQQDAKRAIRFLRYHSKELNISPDHIAILGFSAGGHLAASTGVLPDDDKFALVNDEIDKISARPDALILCYPVIALVDFGHVNCGKHLLGEESTDAERRKLSLENLVTENTPPAFLWHTATDQTVPYKNSIVFAEELWKRGIPAELHIFPSGKHGKSLAEDIPAAGVWPDLAANFIKNIVKFPAK